MLEVGRSALDAEQPLVLSSNRVALQSARFGGAY